jgi:hypothetical protein
MGLKGIARPFGAGQFDLRTWFFDPDQSLGVEISSRLKRTLVIMTGICECQSYLITDAHEWLESRNSPVNIAIIIAMNRDNEEIIISSYARQPRKYGCHSVRCLESISFRKAPGNTFQTTQLDGKTTPPFRIPFNLIFERAPNPPTEHDIVTSQAELQDFATSVWSTQAHGD